MPPIGHPLAPALTTPRTCRGRQERALRSRSCTHAFLPSHTRACKASKPRHHATLALHGRALTRPGRDMNSEHVNLTRSNYDRDRKPLAFSHASLDWDHNAIPSTMPKPPKRFRREHPKPRPPEALKTTSPSPRPLCSPFAPSEHPLSSASSHAASHLLPRRAQP
jgi:hypothetical protein